MDEYIKREVLIAHIKDDIQECGEANSSIRPIAYGTILGLKGALSYAETLPAADVAPVRHGRWLDEDSFDAHYQPIYRCSECGKTVADYFISCHKYCLHCGAKMDGGKKQ